ncbi:MarR family winged helix-turn-helix transcriptional regulator [Rhodococcoides corynebacterioides]|uniref:MarR family winged helix-turn-helix transcriptional regulator n=1 Tax=Rhodococcoides corynebacterioides TaxID=53972 RepID=UPI001C9A2F28|nr:MarR family transcriptional regulator [Rhodococcus corynebacterioides]MBY6348811.1 MarR family transcriptional regulator [Rhodococcus corynebacterioides]
MNDVLALDAQLCFALYSASRATTAAYRPLLEPMGLTYPQYVVMLALWEHDGASVRELGDRLALDSGTLSPLLKRIESLGLITRRRDSADERRVGIHLTDAGRALREQALPVPECIARQSGLTAEEGEQFVRLLRRVATSLRTPDPNPDLHPDTTEEPR